MFLNIITIQNIMSSSMKPKILFYPDTKMWRVSIQVIGHCYRTDFF